MIKFKNNMYYLNEVLFSIEHDKIIKQLISNEQTN